MLSGKIVSIVLCLGWLLTLFLGMLMLMVGAVLFATEDGTLGLCGIAIGTILMGAVLEVRESFLADFITLIERLTK
jgi:hypothetical protein